MAAETSLAGIAGHAISGAYHAAKAVITCLARAEAANAGHAVITAHAICGACRTAKTGYADIACLTVIAVLADVARYLAGSAVAVLASITRILAVDAAHAL